MKKIYQAPIVSAYSILATEVIATSFPIGEDKQNGTTGAKEQRGEWGNLW